MAKIMYTLFIISMMATWIVPRRVCPAKAQKTILDLRGDSPRDVLFFK